MSRGSRTVNYAVGTATNTVTIVNLYKYGGAVWAMIYLYLDSHKLERSRVLWKFFLTCT